MKLETKGVRAVEEVPYGIYVWRCSDGEVLGDGDGNIMNIFCIKGDRDAIRKITEAAKYYGFTEGEPEWWSGQRPVSDEEFQEQITRQKLGLVPDPLDHGAIMDELRGRQNR